MRAFLQKNTMYILWIYIVFFLFLDQITKKIATHLPRGGYAIFGDYFRFLYSENIGVAFSLPLTGYLQKSITWVLIFGIWYLLIRSIHEKKHFLEQMGYASIFSGALGNAYDRFMYGYVVDFLALKYFAIFNVADIVISAWVLFLLIHTIYESRK